MDGANGTGDWQRLYARATQLKREIDDPGRAGDLEPLLREFAATLEALRAKAAPPRASGLESIPEGPEPVAGAERGVTVRVVQAMSELPSGVAHLLDEDEHPLVNVELRNGDAETRRVRVRCAIEGWSSRAVRTFDLPGRGAVVTRLLPRVRHERVRGLREVTRAGLDVQVDLLDDPEVGVRPLWHETRSLWLLAATTAPLGYDDSARKRFVDLTHLIGAWVTPNAEPVQRLLRAAAALHPALRFVGYQMQGGEVEAQVRAIYEAVKRASILYVNSVLTPGVARGTFEQRLRLPRETIRCRSANCMDGVVLMASLLQAASIRSAIVLTAGHSFLAWDRTPDGGEWSFLETTMVSSGTFEDARHEGELKARALAMIHPDHATRDDPQRFAIRPLDAMYRRGVFPME